MAQVDVKDTVVHEAKGTNLGHIFSSISVQKNPLLLIKKTQKFKQQPNF
jgi:hypothetical protein